jgi:hypothetical protein
MSFKNKKHCYYITGRSGHHHTNKPLNTNKHTPPLLTTWETSSKQAVNTRGVVTNVVPRRSYSLLQVRTPPQPLNAEELFLGKFLLRR